MFMLTSTNLGAKVVQTSLYYNIIVLFNIIGRPRFTCLPHDGAL
jgi:hypothetical protein